MKVTTLFLVVFLAVQSTRQDSNDVKVQNVRVKPGSPTVYLDHVCRDKQKVYFRLYNNTIWHISVMTDDLYYPSKKAIKLQNGINTYAAPSDTNVSLQFRIERYGLPWENVAVPKVEYSDNGFGSWVASQSSISFSVPAEYLKKDLQVVVKFHYEWEITKQGHVINDPEHRVSFRGLDFLDTPEKACTKNGQP